MSSGYLLAGRKLPYGDLRRVLVRDQIKVEHWLRHEGGQYTETRTWDDLINLAMEIQSQPDAAAQQRHPEFKFSLSVAIWAAMRLDGDTVDLADCLGQWTWDDLDFYDDAAEAEGKVDAGA